MQGIQGKALAISMEVKCAPKVAVFAVSEGKPFWYAEDEVLIFATF